MFVSVFDVFKISVGPSSSHTMGPMVAAKHFIAHITGNRHDFDQGDRYRLRCMLQGSLAFTGKGHATDQAVLSGLCGFAPQTFNRDEVDDHLRRLAIARTAEIAPGFVVDLDPETDIVFDYDTADLPHPNTMKFQLTGPGGDIRCEQIYLSVGGGFVHILDESGQVRSPDSNTAPVVVPHPFATARDMLDMGRQHGMTIAGMKRANELACMSDAALDQGLNELWCAMEACIERGLVGTGILPGGLSVKRRAAKVRRKLEQQRLTNFQMPHAINDWISLYAMAINEENAAGGQVVTSPTNGAAGVFPAVVKYYLEHIPGAARDRIPDMLLVGAAIGGLIKHNASISGAEVGCQGEIGSASAMAAGAICSVLGGSNEQIENAAEIALEHHLGMTCDPIAGLVQVPCIERNGMGAIKAVAAASLALNGNGEHVVALDTCITTMYETGKDMDRRYKETSLGGLSVNQPAC